MGSDGWDYMIGAMYSMERAQNRAADEAHADSRRIESRLEDLNDEMRDQGYDLEALREVATVGFRVLQANTDTLIDLTRDGFEALARALEAQQETLVSIDQALRNPKAVAAGEQFRVGLQVLKAGFLDDAETAFRHSIELDPLQPMAHLALGLTLSAAGKPAFESFERAYKYAQLDREVKVHENPERGSFTARALILLGAAATSPEELQKTEAYLQREVSPSSELRICGELWLALARVQHQWGRIAMRPWSAPSAWCPSFLSSRCGTSCPRPGRQLTRSTVSP